MSMLCPCSSRAETWLTDMLWRGLKRARHVATSLHQYQFPLLLCILSAVYLALGPICMGGLGLPDNNNQKNETHSPGISSRMQRLHFIAARGFCYSYLHSAHGAPASQWNISQLHRTAWAGLHASKGTSVLQRTSSVCSPRQRAAQEAALAQEDATCQGAVHPEL